MEPRARTRCDCFPGSLNTSLLCFQLLLMGNAKYKGARKISHEPLQCVSWKHHSLLANCLCNNSHYRNINCRTASCICSEHQGPMPAQRAERGAASRKCRKAGPREVPPQGHCVRTLEPHQIRVLTHLLASLNVKETHCNSHSRDPWAESVGNGYLCDPRTKYNDKCRTPSTMPGRDAY